MNAVTERRCVTYKYDAWNRLVEVQRKAAAGDPQTIAAYTYDGLGRRIKKVVSNSGDRDGTQWFYYDRRWRVLEVRDDQDQPDRQFVWGATYIDEAIAMDVDTDNDGDCLDAGGSKRYFYCQDANYNVVALREGSNIVERYEYDPYGNVRIFKGYDPAEGHEDLTVVSDSIAGNPFLFAGYFHGNETGLYHVRHRMYSPTLARWLQRDPLGVLVGLNMYEYSRSAPPSVLDPYGLVPMTCEWAGVRRWADIKWYLTLIWATDIQGGVLFDGFWGEGFPAGLFLRRYRELYKCCNRKNKVVALWGGLLIAWGINKLTGQDDMVLAHAVEQFAIPLPYGQSLTFSLGGSGYIKPGEVVKKERLRRKGPKKIHWAPLGLGTPTGYGLVRHITCCPPSGGPWPGTPPFPPTPKPPKSWLEPDIIEGPSVG